ncbi:MAG: hypothetical protein R3Y54_13005 [Eubacteriales bacterium]
MIQAYIISKTTLKILDVINVSDYSIEHDIDFDGVNIIKVMKKPETQGKDYILLKDTKEIIFQGIIDSVDNEKGYEEYSINAVELEKLFDRNIIITQEELLQEGVEDFIKNAIVSEFVESEDAFLNMEYIEVTCNTHTPIYATIETDNGIYNLKTYMGNIKEYYGIFYHFTFAQNKLNITIEKKEQSTLLVDASVMDIVNYKEVYSVDALAKLKVLWKIPDTEEDEEIIVGESTILEYFLRTDQTVTLDRNDPQRALGTIETIYVEADAYEEVEEEAYNKFTANAYEHSVTAEVKNASSIYPNEELYVRHSCTIKTEYNEIKDSIITRVAKKKNSQYIEVKFGNMEITLIEKLRKDRKR